MLKKFDKGMICRTILQILAYVNQVIAVFSTASFAQNLWYQIISLVATLVTSAVTYWYNNDWTALAILTGKVFTALKDGKIDKNDLEQFMELPEEHSSEVSEDPEDLNG